MADFRKWFPMLAVLALLMGTAANVQAVPFTCFESSPVTPTVRAEGLTELVGDVVLNCDGDVPAEGITANIRIFLNTNVTSRLVNDPGSEALLLIDEPAPGQQNFCPIQPASPCNNPLRNVFQGTQTGVNTIDWLGVPIVAPGSSGYGRVYRITNVRANAFQLGTSSSLIPTQVFMFISISGTTSVPIQNARELVVAFVVPGMKPGVESQPYKQCEDPVEPVLLSFKEGFGTAFKVQGGSGQDSPGVVYDTETGFTPDDPDTPPEIGMADQGTQLMARLGAVNEGDEPLPSGVDIDVPSSVASSAPGGQTLSLVDVTISGGVATILYEVVGNSGQTAISSAAIEEYVVPVTVTYSSTLPGLTTNPVLAYLSFAPLSTVGEASATDPIPRFWDVSTGLEAFSISPCRTLLLFPYLTNYLGFDSGVAISNTSADPFGTDPQSGACVLNYYGNYPATGAPAPSPIDTPEVAAGEQLAYVMSTGGGVVGTTKTCVGCATPGFHGYMIAVCAFQYAHGFAYVSDLGSTRVSEAYLALIIPDNPLGRWADNNVYSSAPTSNPGEQLVH